MSFISFVPIGQCHYFLSEHFLPSGENMKQIPFLRMLLIALFLPAGAIATAGNDPLPLEKLAKPYSGNDGTLEIGSQWLGAEFHRSRSVPSRISFFTPVANSLDIARDYWTRDTTSVFTFGFESERGVDTLGLASGTYRWTPLSAEFQTMMGELSARVTYGFGEANPAMQVRIALENPVDMPIKGQFSIQMNTPLHSCHTYGTFYPAAMNSVEDGVVLDYPYVDTDSASVFLLWPDQSVSWTLQKNSADEPFILKGSFAFELKAESETELVFYLGSGAMAEASSMLDALRGAGEADVATFEKNAAAALESAVVARVPDEWLVENQRWARAVMMADDHRFMGTTIPMPCPAQYNFYFTHDVLVTDLGMVYSDVERVRHDLLFIRSLTGEDQVLPHAAYWKDDHYEIEYCPADNWNHFWIMLTTAAYLRHSGDLETVEQLMPIARTSLDSVLTQLDEDGLMYGKRPDWWDIGNVYGAKTYLTALTWRALHDMAYLAQQTGDSALDPAKLLVLADRMQKKLPEKLFNAEKSYLFNGNGETVDEHYFSGSLVPVWFNMLSDEVADRVLAGAERELLEPALGIRNAMPHDFHHREAEYSFVPGEVGPIYKYFNGGVWPQGTAWYLLGLIQRGRQNDALCGLRSWMTVDGVASSPNGKPCYYEYREIDPDPTRFGRPDKPTFLWTGGWYMNVLMQLAGVREAPFDVVLSPEHPTKWTDYDFDVMVKGERCRVFVEGTGETVESIVADGDLAHSLVLWNPAKEVKLALGTPELPYLETAEATVKRVALDEKKKRLRIELTTIPGRPTECMIVSPWKLKKAKSRVDVSVEAVELDDAKRLRVRLIPESKTTTVELRFK